MKIPRTFAAELKTPEHTPGQRCESRNWVGSQQCARSTNWTCGECGKAVCATHAHWHVPPGDHRIHARTACIGSYCTVWAHSYRRDGHFQ